jgi:DNA modification methylase
LTYISAGDAADFISSLDNESVDLFLIDPPYFGIVDDSWDNQWDSERDYISWLVDLARLAFAKTKSDGSLLMFGGIGKHGSHPFFRIISKLEEPCADGKSWFFRNMITWKKRRAYGKSHDYLFVREELVWFSKSCNRTEVKFNIPYSEEKRGYAGFNKDYPAKSEFKRIGNVWDDIPELMRPKRNCQKPEALIDRLIKTHSNEGDLVVDFFAGYGTTGISALKLGRRFMGCEAIEADAVAADQRCCDVGQARQE